MFIICARTKTTKNVPCVFFYYVYLPNVKCVASVKPAQTITHESKNGMDASGAQRPWNQVQNMHKQNFYSGNASNSSALCSITEQKKKNKPKKNWRCLS